MDVALLRGIYSKDPVRYEISDAPFFPNKEKWYVKTETSPRAMIYPDEEPPAIPIEEAIKTNMEHVQNTQQNQLAKKLKLDRYSSPRELEVS